MTEIKVAVDAVVVNVQERYEDAYACDGVRSFVGYVGHVPAIAFGELPWSASGRRIAPPPTTCDCVATKSTMDEPVLAD